MNAIKPTNQSDHDSKVAPQAKDRRISIPYSFGTSLHDELQDLADEHERGNRSRMAEYFIRKGMAAEAAENPTAGAA